MPEQPQHDAAFRRRRGINWFTLGLTYATFYMGRYNLGVAQLSISKEFGWSKADIGWIISAGLATYGVSTFINGPLSDRFGGRRVLLIGTAGAAVCNLLFGFGALFGVGAKAWLLGYFMAMFAINNYFQSFGACSIVKINAAWFTMGERGVFGGIFGAMIQGGRFLILSLGGLIVAYLPWQWVFFIPSLALAAIFFAARRNVRDSPESAGLPPLETGDASDAIDGPVPFSYLVRKVFSNPVMLSMALTSFCIGLSRHGLDQWMPRYFMEVHHLDGKTLAYQAVSVGAPLCGIIGGLISGTVSDKVFGARRPPVIFCFFVGQLLFFLLLSMAVSPYAAAAAILGASLCINGCHSLLAGVSSMDFGGRHAAASAAGLFDGMQYLAGAVAGHWMGLFLDQRGWSVWAYSLMPTAAVGAILMLFLWNARPRKVSVAPTAEPAAA